MVKHSCYPRTCGAEARRTMSLSGPIFKRTKGRFGGCSSVACLPSMYKAMGSNLSTEEGGEQGKPVIQALGMLKQEDSEHKADLSYSVRS